MTKNEIEHKLKLYLKYIEKGDVPPLFLLNFMAVGATNFLAGGKAWPVTTELKSKINNADNRRKYLQVFALKEIGCKCAKIAFVTDQVDTHERTLSRQVRYAKALVLGSTAGQYEFIWAIEELIETDNQLQMSENKQLLRLKASLLETYDLAYDC